MAAQPCARPASRPVLIIAAAARSCPSLWCRRCPPTKCSAARGAQSARVADRADLTTPIVGVYRPSDPAVDGPKALGTAPSSPPLGSRSSSSDSLAASATVPIDCYGPRQLAFKSAAHLIKIEMARVRLDGLPRCELTAQVAPTPAPYVYRVKIPGRPKTV